MRNQFGGHAVAHRRPARPRGDTAAAARGGSSDPVHVAHLTLHDFRSYAAAEVALGPGVTAFVGRNGQGKTNLVEAIDYLARLSSHRVSTDAPLVRAGAEQAVVRGGGGPRRARRRCSRSRSTPAQANRARVNRSPLPRARELLGMVRTVVFSPEDLTLVKGDPSDRRRFLDDLLVLRAAAATPGSAPTTTGCSSSATRCSRRPAWRAGAAPAQPRRVRARHARGLGLPPRPHRRRAAGRADRAGRGPQAAGRHRLRGGGPRRLPRRRHAGLPAVLRAARARPGRARTATVLAEALLAEVERRRDDELDRGVSLVGPHRDELHPDARAELPVKGYASHGESWSLALALAAGLLRPAPRRPATTRS